MGLRYSPQVFYDLEPYECEEIINKAKEMYKFEHELMYMAVKNAIGNSLDRKYKYVDLFKEEEKENRIVTDEEREKLKEYFEKW